MVMINRATAAPEYFDRIKESITVNLPDGYAYVLIVNHNDNKSIKVASNLDQAQVSGFLTAHSGLFKSNEQ